MLSHFFYTRYTLWFGKKKCYHDYLRLFAYKKNAMHDFYYDTVYQTVL